MRSEIGRKLAWVFAAICVVAAARPAAAEVLQVVRISVTVGDLARTEAFYRDGLGFHTIGKAAISDEASQRLFGVPISAEALTMEVGHEEVEFIQFRGGGRLYPANTRSPDRWFQHFAVVVADMDAAYARLSQVGFTPISVGGPQTLPAASGGVRAFKFRDPDGHPLELIYFPPHKGRPVWTVPHGADVSLGIDHSAISVASTAASKAFYGQLLGMKVAYDQTNRGPEQERLDSTFDAMVRITGLRPRSEDGPGIELLDYRSPPTGRPAPVDSQATDLWHTLIVLRVSDLDQVVSRLSQAEVRFVSAGVIQLQDGIRAVEVLDPDGHTIELEQ